jgi:glycerophosphoryl diester phosphodiesterase
VLVIAHRLPSTAEEAAALARSGANVFELDLQLFRDRLIVSHYLPVMRSFSRVRRDGRRFSIATELLGEPLRDALAIVPDGAKLALDLKTDHGPTAWRMAERLAPGLAEEGVEPSSCFAASKNWGTLRYLRDRGFPTWPSVATRQALARFLAGEAGVGHAGVSIRHSFLTPALMPRLSESLAESGDVVAWTVRAPSRARELVSWGVGGITADSPDVLSAAAGA